MLGYLLNYLLNTLTLDKFKCNNKGFPCKFNSKTKECSTSKKKPDLKPIYVCMERIVKIVEKDNFKFLIT